jgi:hypothetical protein
MFSGNVFVTCSKRLCKGLNRILSGVLTTSVVFSLGIPYIAAKNFARAADVPSQTQEATELNLITPLFTCWERLDSINSRAIFGYNNPNPTTVQVAKGESNTFNPQPSDRNQPEDFLSGRHEYAFTTIYRTDSILSWMLNGLAASTTADPAMECPDTHAPVLVEVTPVSAFTSSVTPSYTFSSTEAGSITYKGSCASGLAAAIEGSNTITLETLAEGIYSNCSIKVTDAAGNESLPLQIAPFTIDSTKPAVAEVAQFQEYTYSFRSSEAGTVKIGSPCASTNTLVTAGINEITFTELPDGTYSNCTITVTDAAGNVSEPLAVSTFEVDITGPVVSIGSGNGNNNSAPVHNESYNGVIKVYATIQDPHLSSYHFRVIKDNDPDVSTCTENYFAPENQGYAKCGFVFNQSVETTENLVNSVITAELDTRLLGPDGIYWLILGAEDTWGHKTSDQAVGDVRIKIIVDTMAPQAPFPVSPANNSLLGMKPHTYSWTPVIDAVEYQLEICAVNPALFQGVCPYIVRTQNVNIPAYTLVTPLDGNFWWRIKARDFAGNWSDFSFPLGLTVDAIAPIADDMPEVIVHEGSSSPYILIKAFDVRQTFLTLEVQYKNQEGEIELPWTPFLSNFPGRFTEDGGIEFEPILLDTQFIGEGVYEYRYYLTDAAGNASNSGYATYAFNAINAYYGNFTFTNVIPVVSAAKVTPAQVFPYVDVEFSGSFTDPSFIPEKHIIVDGVVVIPADDAPWTIAVNYGDGTEIVLEEVWQPGEIQIPPHSYGTSGTYEVTIMVVESSELANGHASGDGKTGTYVLTVVVQDYPVVTINRDSLFRYITGSSKFVCSSRIASPDGIQIDIRHWNNLDSLQGRYTSESSIGGWIKLEGVLQIGPTTTLFKIGNLGDRPSGIARLEVRIVDENGVVISNTDTTTFDVTSDMLNPACGGMTEPITVLSICTDERAETRKWEISNPNPFAVDYTVAVNGSPQATAAMIQAQTKTFFGTVVRDNADLVSVRSFGKTITAVQNNTPCASRNVSVVGPVLYPAVIEEITNIQTPSILEDGISTYRSPALVQTYDPAPTPPAMILGTSVKVERLDNIFTIEANAGSSVVLTTGEGVCEQFFELTFTAKKNITGKIFVYDIGKSDVKILPYPSPNLTFGVCQIVLDGIEIDAMSAISLTTKYSETWLKNNRLKRADLGLFTANRKGEKLNVSRELKEVESLEKSGIRYFLVESELESLPVVFAISPRSEPFLILGLTPFWLASMTILCVALAGLLVGIRKKRAL